MIIIKECLFKIQYWCEIYGVGSNVMLLIEEVVELVCIVLVLFEVEFIGVFYIVDQQVGGILDYIKDGKWFIDNGVIEVYVV